MSGECEYMNILLPNQSALPASLCSELSPALPSCCHQCPFTGVTRVASCSFLLSVNLSNTWREYVQGL